MAPALEEIIYFLFLATCKNIALTSFEESIINENEEDGWLESVLHDISRPNKDITRFISKMKQEDQPSSDEDEDPNLTIPKKTTTKKANNDKKPSQVPNLNRNYDSDSNDSKKDY